MPGETKRRGRGGPVRGLPQRTSAKKLRACQRNGWRHGRRASLGGLAAHYEISNSAIGKRAGEIAAENPKLEPEVAGFISLLGLILDAAFADILTRGVRVELPVVRKGRTVGTEVGANPAFDHVMRLGKLLGANAYAKELSKKWRTEGEPN